MADATHFSRNAARQYTWFLLGMLILAHAAFNAVFNVFRGPQTTAQMMVMGVTLAQPMLFASWVAIGPAPATKRVPMTIAALVAIAFAGAIGDDEWLSSNYPFVAFVLFVATTAAVLIVSRLTGWKIYHTSDNAQSEMPRHQFSLRYLLVITTICAVLLAVGRTLVNQETRIPDYPWQTWVRDMLLPICFLILSMLPTFIALLFVLSGRPRARVIAALPVIWAGLTWLTVETIVALPNVTRAEAVWVIGCMQLGAALTGVFSSLMLRLAGYRLFKRQATLIPSRATDS